MKTSSLPITGTRTVLPQRAWCGGYRTIDAVVVASRVRKASPDVRSIIAASQAVAALPTCFR